MKKEKDKNSLLVEELIKNNDIKTFDDFSDLFSELQGKVLQTLLDAELDCHLGYEKGTHDKKTTDNRRNGYCKEKKVKTKNGTIKVKTPRDRDGSFEPIVIPKKQTMLDSFEDIAISLYAKGVSLRDMEKIFEDMYHVNFNKDQLSYLISKVNDEVRSWQNRELKPIYAFVYIDCLYVSIKDEITSEKKAVYVMIGVDTTGIKEVIGMWIGEVESTTYWRNILEEIKSRGVEDILFISLDGLKGLPEAIEKVYPQTIVQRCIVHLTRNLYDICPKKKAKEIIGDFKKIYTASNKEEAEFEYESFIDKYKDEKSIVKKVTENMIHIYQIMEYPIEIRKMMYTTNTVESVNSAIRKVTRGKGSFPNNEAVYKIIYLRIRDLQEKWNKPVKNWDKILLQLSILFEKRLIKYI